MQSPSTPEDEIWQEIEELFTLLDNVRASKMLGTISWLSINEDEISSILYDKLAVRLQSIAYASGRKIQPYDARALVNESIYEVLSTYGAYREKHRLKDYSRWVMRKKINAYFRQEGRYLPTENEALTKMVSEKDQDKGPGPEGEEAPLWEASLEDIFRVLNVDRQQLSEKELLAFLLKVANCYMEKKLPEAQLAAMAGLKRTTFRYVYKKARDKIYRQWREKTKSEEQKRIGPSAVRGAKSDERGE